jgi:hypothetical protein
MSPNKQQQQAHGDGQQCQDGALRSSNLALACLKPHCFFLCGFLSRHEIVRLRHDDFPVHTGASLQMNLVGIRLATFAGTVAEAQTFQFGVRQLRGVLDERNLLNLSAGHLDITFHTPGSQAGGEDFIQLIAADSGFSQCPCQIRIERGQTFYPDRKDFGWRRGQRNKPSALGDFFDCRLVPNPVLCRLVWE